MERKRARIEIIYDILFFIKKEPNGVKPTHILYRANLSPELLKKYLKVLLYDRLIKKVGKSKRVRYKITERGLVFIKRVKALDKITPIIGLSRGKRSKT